MPSQDQRCGVPYLHSTDQNHRSHGDLPDRFHVGRAVTVLLEHSHAVQGSMLLADYVTEDLRTFAILGSSLVEQASGFRHQKVRMRQQEDSLQDCRPPVDARH